MSRFTHSADRLQSCDGPLLTLLGYDSNGLLGDGWRKLVHPGDRDVAAEATAAFTAGRGGTYRIRNLCAMGDRFYLTLYTFVDQATKITRGYSVLEHWDPVRKHFPILQSLKLKGIV